MGSSGSDEKWRVAAEFAVDVLAAGAVAASKAEHGALASALAIPDDLVTVDGTGSNIAVDLTPVVTGFMLVASQLLAQAAAAEGVEQIEVIDRLRRVLRSL